MDQLGQQGNNMNDESKIVISHADLCRAVAFWMTANVTRYGVEVSGVDSDDSRGYGGDTFTITFKRAAEQQGAGEQKETAHGT